MFGSPVFNGMEISRQRRQTLMFEVTWHPTYGAPAYNSHYLPRLHEQPVV
jgi:hypothetical protein